MTARLGLAPPSAATGAIGFVDTTASFVGITARKARDFRSGVDKLGEWRSAKGEAVSGGVEVEVVLPVRTDLAQL